MEVISMSDDAFYELINKLLKEMKEKYAKTRDKWIDGEEAMQMLRITSKSTLQKLRDTGAIRFSQPMPKVILYDSDSILKYIEKHSKGPSNGK